MKTRHSIECWIFGPDGSVLMLHKPTRQGYWQPVTGGIEPGETPLAAAQREAFEETGQRLAPEALTLVEDGLEFPTEPDCSIVKTVFYAHTTDSAVTVSDEHDGFRWIPTSEVTPLLKWQSNRTTWETVLGLQRPGAAG